MQTSRDLRYDPDDPLTHQRYMQAAQTYALPHQPQYHDRRQRFERQFHDQYPQYDVMANDPPPPLRRSFIDGSAFNQTPPVSSAKMIQRQAMGLSPIAGSLLTQQPIAGSVSDLMMTNKIDFKSSNDRASLLAAPADESRAMKERRTRVNIDSVNRDQANWPTPSHYSIHLGRTFTNIKRVTLISTEIPNTEQLVKATPPTRQNNLIFWQNQLDGNSVYVGSVTAGNYDALSLQAALQASMNGVKRTNGTYHNFTITIDAVTEICTFTQAVSSYIATPFASTARSSVLTVNQQNHGFGNQTLISIMGAVSVGGISQNAINTTQIITVVDVNTYTFDCGVPATQTVTNGGGASVQISTGLLFQLMFSQSGTVGTLLGFRAENTGYALSQSNTSIASTIPIAAVAPIADTDDTLITTQIPHNLSSGTRVYITSVSGSDADNVINDAGGYIITVSTLTEFSIPVNTTLASTPNTGQVLVRTLNNPVNLSPENYILMTSPVLPSMSNSGEVDNVFAKIQLSGPIGSTMFNSHIASPMNFDDAFLPILSDLEVQFMTALGVDYEFNNVNHSFTLEIVEMLDVPTVTGFDTRRGTITES